MKQTKILNRYEGFNVDGQPHKYMEHQSQCFKNLLNLWQEIQGKEFTFVASQIMFQTMQRQTAKDYLTRFKESELEGWQMPKRWIHQDKSRKHVLLRAYFSLEITRKRDSNWISYSSQKSESFRQQNRKSRMPVSVTAYENPPSRKQQNKQLNTSIEILPG